LAAKKLLIFGAGETATIAAEFFVLDTKESLSGFVVDDKYWRSDLMHHGYRVHPLSSMHKYFSPTQYKIFIGLSYGELNRQRLKVFQHFESLGYELTSYISPRATIWRTATIGKNCMIFEGNNIQHGAKIEDNVILWSGNHIGHGSKICHSSYLSSHVCIAGFSEIGERSFIGINASIIDQIKVAEDCFIAAGAMVNKNTEKNSIYSGNPAVKNEKVTAQKFFRVKS